MVLSILSINYNDNDDKDDVFECFEMTMPEIVSTLKWNKETKQHVENNYIHKGFLMVFDSF
jgi:hypothetical protein